LLSLFLGTLVKQTGFGVFLDTVENLIAATLYDDGNWTFYQSVSCLILQKWQYIGVVYDYYTGAIL
jgi:hypothetical protein